MIDKTKILKEFFEENGFTQASVAEKIGVTQQYVQQILAGKPIGARVAKKIQDQFGITTKWLLYGDGEMFIKNNEKTNYSIEKSEYDKLFKENNELMKENIAVIRENKKLTDELRELERKHAAEIKNLEQQLREARGNKLSGLCETTGGEERKSEVG